MKNIKRLIASTLAVLSLITVNPLLKAHAEWKQNNVGWWYTESNSWATGWRLIDGQWYYFYSDGYMAHDTTIDGCVIGSNGAWIEKSSSPVSTAEEAKEKVAEYFKTNDYGVVVTRMNVVDTTDCYVVQCYYEGDDNNFYAYIVEKATGEVYSAKM